MPSPRRKRESELQRPRSRQGKESQSRKVTKGRQRGQRWYAANPEWPKSIKNIWNAAKSSGGSEFYEQSDIAMLWQLLDDFYRAHQGRLSGQLLQTLYAQLNRYLLTETDRRAAGIELEELPDEEEKPAEVVAIEGYKDALKKSAKDRK